MSAERYVCAFRGRRDSYQAPLALSEADLLDRFITDAYAQPWACALSRLAPDTVRAKAEFRSEPGIPVERVRCLWGTTALEHLRHGLGCTPLRTFSKLDRHFSLAAAKCAEKSKAHLFLYSPYAWEAFTSRYPHTPRKVLFQYHPHPALERRLLAWDRARHPEVGETFSHQSQALPEELARRERDCWRHADLILCASAFTKQSLVEAGCDEQRCCIVPYGVELPPAVDNERPTDTFQAVFVGSGGQRKGLHHLLLAWKNAKMPLSSKLTLVCRVLDRGIEAFVADTPRVELRRGVAGDELQRLYARSSLVVMPSLVEGFGQVYLEALAQGCPVLGTANTCLPDIGTEAGGVFLTPPGNVDALIARLEWLAGLLQGNRAIRAAARACAGKFTWPAFRQGVRQALMN